jgi:hypothetical protein
VSAGRVAPSPRRGADHERGQGLVEFSLVVPAFLLLLLGMLEFGFAFDQNLTLQYATREGARVGSALVNGGGPLGCGASQSPNAATVDDLIIAAVNRVLTSPGSRVRTSDVPVIRIYKAGNAGQELGPVNVWTYSAGAGPTVDGKHLDYLRTTTTWAACGRSNGSPADSIGVSLTYTYRMATPLGGITGFSTIAMSDRTIMQMNPTN